MNYRALNYSRKFQFLSNKSCILETKPKINTYFFILLYKLTIEVSYFYTISPWYSYMGFNTDFSMEKYIYSTIIFLIMLHPTVKLLNYETSSSIIIFLLSVVYFIPGCSFYALTNANSKYFLYMALYWLLLIEIQYYFGIFKKRKNKDRHIGNEQVFKWILIASAVLCVVISGYYARFRISITLSSFYDFRREAREFSMPTIIEYLYSWARTIIPMGLVYSIIKKRRYLTVILITTQVLNFSFNGKKSVLMMLLLSVIIAKFYHSKGKRWIMPAFLSLNVISLVEGALRSGFSNISKYIIRRVMFMPPLLGSLYFDYFSTHELDYLRQSVLRWFGFVSPYAETSIQRLIGLLYFGNIEGNANTGLCGDAFANFGWFGLIVYPLLIVIALKALDACSEGLDPRILAIIWIQFFYTFINGSFFTIMLTNAFMVVCILLWICPRDLSVIGKKGEIINEKL